MAVYVDNFYAPYRRMLMCHMAADSLQELHDMADCIGVDRRWFQDHARHPHYDVSKGKRALAVRHGAVEVSVRELLRVASRLASEL